MSDRAIHDLVSVCRLYGMDLLQVQGGGGNASIKSGDGQWMWVKASGTRLADVTPSTGIVKVYLPAVRGVLDLPSLEDEDRQVAQERSSKMVLAAVRDDTGLRPSLETLFHAVLGDVVLHTHPVLINSLACLEGGRDVLSKGIWVPYAPPGVELGARVASWCTDENEGILVFQNHGLVVHGGDVRRVRTIMECVLAHAESLVGPIPPDGLGVEDPPEHLKRWGGDLKSALSKRFPGSALEVRASKRVFVNRYGSDPASSGDAGALVPDDVVYGVHRLIETEISDPAQRCVDEMPDLPPDRLAVAVKGGGTVFGAASPDAVDAMEETLLAHVLVRFLIARLQGHPVFLPEEEIRFIECMESERYRRGVVDRDQFREGES
ncbi:MAG: class II aldolase/adducin family protein [bacterium]|nr:class II aldolase/adducin family protein [bacterium]